MRISRVVTHDQIALLPSIIHQKIAYQLIASGEWAIKTTPATNQEASRKEVD